MKRLTGLVSAIELNDLVDNEIALAVGAAVALVLPWSRRLLRRGAVMGLSSLLSLGSAVGTVLEDFAPTGRDRGAASSQGLEDIYEPPSKPRRTRTRREA